MKIFAKSWLKDNKIYFEIFAMVLLGIMALAVSLSQLFVSIKEMKLMSAQLRVAERGVDPLIIPTSKYVDKSDLGVYAGDVLNIVDEGAPVFEFHPTCKVMLGVTIKKISTGEVVLNKDFALRLYYDSYVPGDGRKGVVAVYSRSGNNLKIFDLEKSIEGYAKLRGYSANIAVRRYLRVSYLGSSGSKVTKFFIVGAAGTTELMPQEEGRRKFHAYDQAVRKHDFLRIDKVNAGGFVASLFSGLRS
ncbi:hypothetical protein HF690_05535 [Oleiagrimonas citrea]|uniref:Uncharacterized protein n=1 Tax=Oleiagrimonas citrea TaxID=1665687 RepID=A0A846ZLE6_9GAMM|nr:hypothetical protein [Oleiagrimonas citrea]NKZ38419.1 hypothetical protein [Oleiagrimonas citrea]